MKKMKFLFFLALLFSSSTIAFGQSKYGKDSIKCLQSLQFYQSYFKSDNIEEAAPLWRDALKYCPPTSNHGVFFNGQTILKYFLNKGNISAQRKSELLDSLVLMYDRRIQYFPKYTISAQMYKSYDLNAYSQDDQRVYDEMIKTIDLVKGATEPEIFVLTMQRAKNLVEKKLISTEKVMDLYTLSIPILEAQIKEGGEFSQRAVNVKRDFETLFAASGVATCENLVQLFTPKFDANPNDKDFVSKLVSLLSNGNCIKEDLFLRSVESLNKLDPSYKTAYYLFRLYYSKEDGIKDALKYLQEAIDSDQSSNIEDADYLMELAACYYGKLDNRVKAVEACKLAMQKNPQIAGKAYMFIASVWANNRCGGDEVASRANFWVACDYYTKAKNADPSLAADADKTIATFRQHFPAQEDAFMYDIAEGSPYTVNCGGLRETTTVRTRK